MDKRIEEMFSGFVYAMILVGQFQLWGFEWNGEVIIGMEELILKRRKIILLEVGGGSGCLYVYKGRRYKGE